jgi:hypothetical protein
MASNPDRVEKKDNCLKTYVDDSLLNELALLAATEERKLSDYIERVLSRHVFGHGRRRPPPTEGSDRPG